MIYSEPDYFLVLIDMQDNFLPGHGPINHLANEIKRHQAVTLKMIGIADESFGYVFVYGFHISIM